MIRFDRNSDWADTRLTGPSSAHGMDDAERDERSAILTAAPRIVRNGLDYQGRYPSALGQISNAELQRYSTGHPIAGESCAEDEQEPQTNGDRVAMLIVGGVSAACVILLAVHLWARFA